MIKKNSWQILLGSIFIALSGLIYYVHYLIFHDAHHIFIYLLGDIAFVPIEVLLVTLIIHRMLSNREKQSLIYKLNMLIGTFFSEIGTSLLDFFSDASPSGEQISQKLKINGSWSDESFDKAALELKAYSFEVDIDRIDLYALKNLLASQRDFLVGLLQNSNLLEHETFTNILWATFHLLEELSARKSLENLPEKDLQHLSGDINRIYKLLTHQWLDYMEHLKNSYSYLFSLAMRTNPFDKSASAVID